MRSFTIKDFEAGLKTAKAEGRLKPGEASDILNWNVKDGRIELSGGSTLIGTTTYSGQCTGLISATKGDGTTVVWIKVGAKLYAKDGTADWAEVGTDLFGTSAATDIASFAEWKGITGQWMFVSSANGGLHKLSVAKPTSYVSFPSAGFAGDIAIIQNRLWVSGWKTTGGSLDTTGFQLSYQPPSALSDYTAVTAESYGTGNGVLVTFSHTLAFKAGAATRNCFSVSVTDGVETFSDVGNGTLSGSAGGTGTIDYSTGAASVTFHAAPAGAAPITTSYLWEDSSADGLADFSPVSEAAGDGKAHYLPQPGVGESRGVYAYSQKAYCLHSNGVYEVTFDVYGDPASNLVFRTTSGPSSKTGAVATAEGIYYVDDTSTDVNLRVITLVNSAGNSYMDNPSVSDDVDLSGYSFANSSLAASGDIIAITCNDGGSDDTVFLHDRRLKSFVRHRYPARLVAPYGTGLMFGDTALGAAYTLDDGTLFSGEPTDNLWDGGDHDCGYEGLKRSRHIWIKGRISDGQTIEVYMSTENGGFSLIGSISGTDSQVDNDSTGAIGDDEIGGTEIGLYTSEDSNPFAVSFPWNAKFGEAKPRIKATGVGAASIEEITFHDLRLCGSRLAEKYRT